MAQATPNPGDNARKIKGYYEEAKKLYDEGRTGTDDFKEMAAFLDEYGRTDPESFIKNYNAKYGF